jgi:ATP synthase protein I
MSYAGRVLRATLRRLLMVQLLLVLLAMLAYAAVKGSGSAWAAGYGGGIALANTIVMAWRVGRSNSSSRALVELYIGAGIRFALTLFLMAVGMGWLKLDPLALILGFAIAQVGYLFNRVPTDVGASD